MRSSRWTLVILALAACFFFIPLVATFLFSLWQGGNRYDLTAYVRVASDPQLWQSLRFSLELAVEVALLSLILMIPSLYWAHLASPRLKAWLDALSFAPLVVPSIVLLQGLTALYQGVPALIGFPQLLVLCYTILSLPYAYRTLDVGMSALDVRTLTEAAQSLGAGWGRIFFRILLPNLRSSLLGAVMLIVTLVLGEFVLASILLYQTFAVFINYIGETHGTEAAALALMSFALTWLAMALLGFAGGRRLVQLGGTR
jgi:putative spermidine/putrescine transport system permease protein